MEIEHEFMSISEAAEVLGVAATTLKRWHRNGKIPVTQDPLTNTRMYSPEDIQKIREYISQKES
jgi:DNA (cytosine-5)-methyltransferase 1